MRQSTNLATSAMQFFNSFPFKYVAKNKDMCRKNKLKKTDIKGLIHGSFSRWKAEAEEFRNHWLNIAEAKLN